MVLGIGLAMERRLVAMPDDAGHLGEDHPIFIQPFEVGNLMLSAGKHFPLFPAAGCAGTWWLVHIPSWARARKA